mmetsp:Transcript_26293/g.71120  ORF Transcript_26293/g.71120 Transcript_26293/m.71120 type:complete len:219 (+) Transcript_26293:4583-5239(+)
MLRLTRSMPFLSHCCAFSAASLAAWICDSFSRCCVTASWSRRSASRSSFATYPLAARSSLAASAWATSRRASASLAKVISKAWRASAKKSSSASAARSRAAAASTSNSRASTISRCSARAASQPATHCRTLSILSVAGGCFTSRVSSSSRKDRISSSILDSSALALVASRVAASKSSLRCSKLWITSSNSRRSSSASRIAGLSPWHVCHMGTTSGTLG